MLDNCGLTTPSRLGAEAIAITLEATDLPAAYEAHAVLGPRFRADMLHIALATVAEVEGCSDPTIRDWPRRSGGRAVIPHG